MTTQLSVAADRTVAVAVLLAVAIVALIGGISIGAPLALAAVAVLAVQLARIGALLAACNRRALDLIAQGRGDLPVEAVVRVRQRLLDPAQRECLARALEVMRVEAWRPPDECHRIPPLYRVPVVRAVSPELGEVARLVRVNGGLRGVAATEQMVTDGRSPLYGDVETVLRQELGRICFLFASRDVDGGEGRAKPARTPAPPAAAGDTVPAVRRARSAG